MKHKTSLNTPLSEYHGVPKGWFQSDILKRYIDLGGRSSIEPDVAAEPGAPSYLPDRYNWLQYRATLYEIAGGVKRRDKAFVELAIQYIELDYFGSYSGFIRERFARLLKSADLSLDQADRLMRHFESFANSKHYLKEFREYKKLWHKICQDRQMPNNRRHLGGKKPRDAQHISY